MKRLPAWILCVLGPFLAAPQLLAQTGSISASPNPCTIAAGKKTCTTTLRWSASGASRLRVMVSHNGGSAGNFATSGSSGSQSASWIQASPSHTYTFYLYDYSRGSLGARLGSVRVTGKAPPKPKAPTISSFSASPTAIDKGKSSTLKWSTSNATSVSISPGIGTVSAQGYRTVSPSSTTTYTLTATNSVKSVKATAKVTVRPVSAPTATITASPTSIDKGKSSTLKWSTANATSVFISPGIGTVSASGSRTVSPSSTTTYVLTATNSIKSIKVSAKVTVRPPSTVSGSISASPNPCTIAVGKKACTTTLTWSATGTSGLRVLVSHNGRSATNFATSGSSGSASPSWIQAAPANTYTFSLYDYAGRVQGKLLDSVKVTGKAPPKPPKIISFRASPSIIDKGKSSTLSWSTTDTDSLSISPDIGTVTGTSVTVSPDSTTTYTLTATNSVKADTAIAKVTVRQPAPTISSFTASPATIGKGERSTLRWSTSNADTLSITPGIGTLTDTQRRLYARTPLQVSPTVTTTYTLTAANSTKSVKATAKVTVGPPRISGTISVATLNPCAIETGQDTCTAKIQWTVKNTNSVKVYRSVNGGTATLFATATGDGSRVATGIKGSPNTYVFQLYDYSSGSRGARLGSVTVTGRRVPTATFTANPETIDQGEFSTLSWSTANADSVFLSPGVGTVSASGSRKVSPNSTTTYTLNVTNAARSVKLRVTVEVRKTKAPTISSFSASPATIDKGKSSTLSWSTTDADTLSITPGKGTLTDAERRLYARTGLRVSPSSTTTYTLTATNSAKSVTATAKVTVRGTQPVVSGEISASPNPCTIAVGKSTCTTTLTWSATGTSGLLVRVSRNGQASTVVSSSGASGSASPSWIQAAPANTYTFSLYDYANRVQGKLLDSVTVTGKAPSKPPTISFFTASPTAIDKGKSSTLKWSTTDATNISISPGIGTVKPQGYRTVSPSSTTTYTLTATNSAKSVTATVKLTVRPVEAPTASITATPTTIDKGKSSTLKWSTTDATSIFISPGIGTVSASGSRTVSPSKTTTYVLTATNSIKSVKVSVEVTVRPPSTVTGKISASPNPCTIAMGETTCTTTLMWSATGTSGLLVRVSRNGGSSTVVSSSGATGSTSPSWIQAAPANTYTFSLYDYAGRVQGKLLDSVTVTGKAPPKPPTISSFTASPTSIEKGKSATLKWSTAAATSVSITPGIGTVSASGSHSVSPSSTTTYTLKATNSVKSVEATLTVTVRPPPAPRIGFFMAIPRIIDKGRSTTLSWRAHDADTVSITPDTGPDIGRVTGVSLKVSPSSTTTYTLTATNSVKSVTATATVTVQEPSAPKIIYFIPLPSTIDKGESATLRWSVENADTLSISPDIGKDIGRVTGTSLKVSPSSTTTYTLTATNSVGSVEATATLTVKGTQPAPKISSFTADPETIAKGERSTLKWKTTNAETLSITPGIGTLTDTQRRAYAIRPLQVSPTATTTYTLKATNAAGSVEATATVTVGPPRISGIISVATLNPCAIEEGTDTCGAKIQWTVKNTKLVKVYVSVNGEAETLFATATGDGSREATGIRGSPNTYVFSLYDYTGDTRGALLGSVTLTGRRVPTATFTATPETIDQGQFSTLKWSTANADSVFISPGVGSVSAQGTREVPPNSTTTYTLNVTNAARSVKFRVTVTVRKTKAPTIGSFTATPTTITKGQSATLRWSTTDAETLSISPGIGTLTETQRRAYRIRPLRVSPSETTTYTLKATNRVKSVTATVKVTVEAPNVSGKISVSPDPCTIYHGQTGCTPTVTWESKGATSVQVWYSLNGGEEQYLASSDGGGPYSKKLDVELQEGDSIDFKLYDYSSGTRGALVEETEKSLTVQEDIGCPPASK